MSLKVDCYAGSMYPEKPKSFSLEGQHFEVQSILDQRREPDGISFLVSCSPGDAIFDLHYTFSNDQWQIHPKELTINLERTHPNQKS